MGVKTSGAPASPVVGADEPTAVPLAATVVITGVSGFLGQAVLRRLAGSPAVGRVVGLDVREPGFRPRGLQFHLVDVTGSDLAPLFEGADVLVHLAGVHDAIPDEELMARVNVGGTRRVLEAAASAGVSKVVLVSSAAVYGAWPNNPIPLNEDAPLRPNPGFPLGVHKAEVERLLAEWALARPAVVTTVLRPAFVLGARADHAVARLIRARVPLAVGGSTAPVQFVHEDDATEAIALAVERDLPGVYNVAADGWLSREELRALDGRRRRRGGPGHRRAGSRRVAAPAAPAFWLKSQPRVETSRGPPVGRRRDLRCPNSRSRVEARGTPPPSPRRCGTRPRGWRRRR